MVWKGGYSPSRRSLLSELKLEDGGLGLVGKEGGRAKGLARSRYYWGEGESGGCI
jgi:hypothetical protein